MARVEHAEWPPDGRLGICRCGPSAGQHVLLIADPSSGQWTLYLEPPFDAYHFGGTVFSYDNYLLFTEDGQNITDDWCIEWLESGAEERALERKLFNQRQFLVHNVRARRSERRRKLWRTLGWRH